VSRILVLSPHPDDEAIGCGGTIRKHVKEGDTVHVVFLTSGEKGGHGRTAELTRRLREREARKAARILGVAQAEFWREPDGTLRATTAAVARLRRKVRTWRPDRIYVTHDRETHPDHRASVRLLRRAFDGAGPLRKKPLVLMYEIWTPIQRIDEIVDVSPYMKAKLAAVRAYKTQCQVLAFDEAVAGLNRYRGEMHSWPGGDYAEIFTRMRL
jgi:LmbE family N-acetylglucosaminyl deacetylase